MYVYTRTCGYFKDMCCLLNINITQCVTYNLSIFTFLFARPSFKNVMHRPYVFQTAAKVILTRVFLNKGRGVPVLYQIK